MTTADRRDAILKFILSRLPDGASLRGYRDRPNCTEILWNNVDIHVYLDDIIVLVSFGGTETGLSVAGCRKTAAKLERAATLAEEIEAFARGLTPETQRAQQD